MGAAAVKALTDNLGTFSGSGSRCGREARMWEISENLHRNNLDRAQRALHEAEWIKLSEEDDAISGQVDQKLKSVTNPKGAGRRESGIAKAARELPVKGETDEARRARRRRETYMSGIG